jgi:hypothetical protein
MSCCRILPLADLPPLLTPAPLYVNPPSPYPSSTPTPAHSHPLPQVLNPATGAPIATLPKMKAGETLAAIAAAATVYPSWSALTAKQRGAVLRR